MKCEIVQERSTNQHWSVDFTGEIVNFLGDGGSSEFSNYLCTTHQYDSESWNDMQKHKEDQKLLANIPL